MNPTRPSPHRILLRILRQAWGTTRGLRWSRFLPPSHLVRVPTNPTGPRPLSRIRTPAHQGASVTDLVHLRTSPRGTSTSMELHHSQPRAKGIQRQRTITSRSPRSHTRISTPSRTLTLLPARDHLSNQMHHRLCTTLKTLTIRLSRIFSRIRRYPRYQVLLLPVSPPPSSTIAAINSLNISACTTSPLPPLPFSPWIPHMILTLPHDFCSVITCLSRSTG
jgi:hypothetical protein